MLIDEVQIRVQAGAGGRGAVSFNSSKFAQGPTGGNGGRGGSIWLEGNSDLNSLEQFRFKKEIHATDGAGGRARFVDGSDGKDIVLAVPAGTVIHNLTTGFDTEITKVGERLLLAEGGLGGKGNFKFRSPTNTSPKEFQTGLPGQAWDIRLELKLIAAVGLIGLPNAGKSSLLNTLTKAQSKIGAYPFTTLEPNLGSYYGTIIADIPGLIEGAAGGKGLGIKFLRHIERTTTLFHLISAETSDINADYQTIRRELENYNPDLLKKKEYLLLTKIDNITPNDLAKLLLEARKISPAVLPISILDEKTLLSIQQTLQGLKNSPLSI
jgi:GTPase